MGAGMVIQCETASDVLTNEHCRFKFGENWQKFLATLDEAQINEATESLKKMLDTEDLRGRSFLDIGSGSGLFSLVARRLGARVLSFDLDQQSVNCTRELRNRFFPDDPEWSVQHGSILDADYVASLENHDVVYSWGVLHHTGAMWPAIEAACSLVADNGKLFIALYNDQGVLSRYWKGLKKYYNRCPALQTPLQLLHAPYFVGLGWFVRKFRYRGERAARGMTLWIDMVDWLGGYPFEVATPVSVTDFIVRRGFVLENQFLVGKGVGCNEFVFLRDESPTIATR